MEITTNAIQTVATNGVVLFNETAICGGSSIMHREGSGLVNLRGLGQRPWARFRVTFGANVAVPTGQTVGPVSLAIAVQGEPIATTTMISTPAAVDEYNNVSRTLFLTIPFGCCQSVSVKNISTIPVNVQNASLIIERVA